MGARQRGEGGMKGWGRGREVKERDRKDGGEAER